MKRLQRPSAAKARALALAAIRETFEETGCCSACAATRRRDSGRPVDRCSPRPGSVPISARLHFIARAITPPGRPRRFDARFFAVDAGAIAHRIEGVTGPDAELVELVWLPLVATPSSSTCRRSPA